MKSTSVADAIRAGEQDELRALLDAARGEDPRTLIARLEAEMLEAARGLDFERAASLRDRAEELRETLAAVETGATAGARAARGRRTPREARRHPRRFGPDR